jgi:hypothetical protein
MMPATRFVSKGPVSPLDGVSTDAWQQFIAALEIQPTGAVSESGGLGAYAIRPRRLVEIERAVNLRYVKKSSRYVHECDFELPWTKSKFLADPLAQYTVLARSMKLFYDALRRGDLTVPNGCSLAGALAILHVGGKGALKSFPKLFEHTQTLYERAQGAF